MCASFVCWGQGTKRQLQRGMWHMKDDAKQNTNVMPHKAPTTRTSARQLRVGYYSSLEYATLRLVGVVVLNV